MKAFKYLVVLTLALTLLAIMLGAYTRLTHAGLGCPDWPGCYGFLQVPDQPEQLEQAQQNFPQQPLVVHKAHNEMRHRYVAGLLGLAVVTLWLASLRLKAYRNLTSSLVLIVILQATLGMLTVNLNLLPLIVLGHLWGGFILLGLLSLLLIQVNSAPSSLSPSPPPANPTFSNALQIPKKIKLFAIAALSILAIQISLGAWTSSNYAALACHSLPLCDSGWQAHFDLASALQLPIGHNTYEYGVLPPEARLSIHVLHRLGAITTALVLSSFSFLVWRTCPWLRVESASLGLLLILQIGLGVTNVLAVLPLSIALMHNLVAAALWVNLLAITHYLLSSPAPISPVNFLPSRIRSTS